MATKPAAKSAAISFTQHMLTIKDLLTIVSIAVSLAIAWGVFSTRLTVLEREVIDLQSNNKEIAVSVDKLQQQVSRLNAHQQDDELIIDQAFSLLRRPPPIRHATN